VPDRPPGKLADHTGRLLWRGHRFHTITAELDRLWQRLPAGTDPTQVMVVMEPTRNAWVLLAAWLRRRGACVILVPPERSADLRASCHQHTKTDRLEATLLARLPLLHPDGCAPSTAWAQPTRCAGRPSCARPWSSGAHHPGPAGRPIGAPRARLVDRARRRPGQQDPAAVAGRRLRRPAHPQAARQTAPGSVHLPPLPRRLGRRLRRGAAGCRDPDAEPVGRRAGLRRAGRRHRRGSPPGAAPDPGDQRTRRADRGAAGQARPDGIISSVPGVAQITGAQILADSATPTASIPWPACAPSAAWSHP
jgi:Transposase